MASQAASKLILAALTDLRESLHTVHTFLSCLKKNICALFLCPAPSIFAHEGAKMSSSVVEVFLSYNASQV